MCFSLGSPKYLPFKFCKVLSKQKMIVLIDSGATHNFINTGLVMKSALKAKEFEGFNVTIVDGSIIPSNRVIKQINIALRDHKVCYDFYVIGLRDIDMILSI